MTIDQYFMESVRNKRVTTIEHPLKEDDIKVWHQAGHEFDTMKDALKVEYQVYRLTKYQADRRMTYNKSW